MSQMFVLPSLELLLIAGRAVALVMGLLIFAWAFRHWRRAASRDTQRVFEQLDLVRSELLIMKEVMHHSAHRSESGAASVRTGSKGTIDYGQFNQSHLNQALAPTTHSTHRLLATPGGTARGYEIAARMARNGAGKDELIRNCGVTGHEAELLVKLHGQRRAAGAELIGRQPRVAESAAASNLANTPRESQSNNPLLQTRQTATTSRPAERAAPAAKSPAIPRSRLVAVG